MQFWEGGIKDTTRSQDPNDNFVPFNTNTDTDSSQSNDDAMIINPTSNLKLTKRSSNRLYDNSISSVIDDPYDRDNLYSVRIPEPLPASYIQRNNFKVDHVRQCEKMYRDIYISFGNIEGYISPVALINGVCKVYSEGLSRVDSIASLTLDTTSLSIVFPNSASDSL